MSVAHPSGPIRRIAIVGGGLEAWITALFLARTLDAGTVAIKMVPIGRTARDGRDPEAIGYAHIAPESVEFLGALGIDPRTLTVRSAAGFSLGIRYEDSSGSCKVDLPFGTVGTDWLGCPFHHYWVRAAKEGLDLDYTAHSLPGQAMRTGVFAPPEQAMSVAKSVPYSAGMTCDPWALTEIAREHAIAVGVQQSARESIEDLTVISPDEADLVIDCSHSSREECGQKDDAARSWVVDEIDEPPRPFVTVRTSPEKWSIITPILARRALRARIPPPSATRFEPPWRGRVVAIGRAAIPLCPVLPLHWPLLQAQLEALIDLLPGHDLAAVEVKRYNDQIAEIARQATGATALLSVLRAADREQALRAAPFSTQQLVELFRSRGSVTRDDPHIMPAHEWAKLLLAHGVLPRHTNPFSEHLPLDQLRAALSELRRSVTMIASRFPPYGPFISGLRQHLGAPE